MKHVIAEDQPTFPGSFQDPFAEHLVTFSSSRKSGRRWGDGEEENRSESKGQEAETRGGQNGQDRPVHPRPAQAHYCALDKLHEHIQTAMGWTNSHLHEFEIDGERYGDPELLDDGFEDFKCVDSTITKISEFVPKAGKRFRFLYEYDFGDDWEHARAILLSIPR